MNKEMTPNLLESYLTKIIIDRHERTATLAAQDDYDPEILEEAIYYDDLYNYPTPGESKDDENLDRSR